MSGGQWPPDTEDIETFDKSRSSIGWRNDGELMWSASASPSVGELALALALALETRFGVFGAAASEVESREWLLLLLLLLWLLLDAEIIEISDMMDAWGLRAGFPRDI